VPGQIMPKGSGTWTNPSNVTSGTWQAFENGV
jgi:hypothetical protein